MHKNCKKTSCNLNLQQPPLPRYIILATPLHIITTETYSVSSDMVCSKANHTTGEANSTVFKIVFFYKLSHTVRISACLHTTHLNIWYSIAPRCWTIASSYEYYHAFIHIKYCRNYVNTMEYYTRHLRSLRIYRDL